MTHDFKLADPTCSICGLGEFHASHNDGAIITPTNWQCIIGSVERIKLPRGSDGPMRDAIEAAFCIVTGEESKFCFSGWNAQLNPSQIYCVNKKR